MIISNPPYISSAEMRQLEAELFYEPFHSLWGGDQGTRFIDPIIRSGKPFLSKQGTMLLEIGYQQGQIVRGIYQSEGFDPIQMMKDDAGHDRMVMGDFGGAV